MNDSTAQQKLNELLELYSKPINSLDDFKALKKADLVISSIIEHGVCSLEMKQKMIETLTEVESFIMKHPMFKITDPHVYVR